MQENKQEELLSKIKILIAELEKSTLKQLEEDIDRGYGIFQKKVATLNNLNKIDVGLQLIHEGVKGLNEQ